VARVTSALMVSPAGREVDMPIDGGFVGMVDREVFDEWLRERAAAAGAVRRVGTFERISRDNVGVAIVEYRSRSARKTDELARVRARTIIGADGAASAVARQEVPSAARIRYVYAYHEIVRSPRSDARDPIPSDENPAPKGGPRADFDGSRCDVYYRGSLSPDFYGWIFPHGDTTSVGSGSAHKGFSIRSAVGALREVAGLDATETIRREGAPIPLRPLRRWDNGRDVVLAGDAAGVVAPASGEGIYYAMAGGRLAADAVEAVLATGDVRALRSARKRFMRAHGKVFLVLGIMQWFWYADDKRRERFVSICKDPDVQQLTWQAYMHKKLVRAKPIAHVRIFFKDLAHLVGLVSP
jgi:geranylgeranyl reductase